MTTPEFIQRTKDALAGSSVATDGDVEVLYLAVARSALEAARREVDALSAIVTAREQELVRRRHGDAQQLALGGGK